MKYKLNAVLRKVKRLFSPFFGREFILFKRLSEDMFWLFQCVGVELILFKFTLSFQMFDQLLDKFILFFDLEHLLLKRKNYIIPSHRRIFAFGIYYIKLCELSHGKIFVFELILKYYTEDGSRPSILKTVQPIVRNLLFKIK